MNKTKLIKTQVMQSASFLIRAGKRSYVPQFSSYTGLPPPSLERLAVLIKTQGLISYLDTMLTKNNRIAL